MSDAYVLDLRRMNRRKQTGARLSVRKERSEYLRNVMSTSVEYYCQRCLAANSLSEEFCRRCGTRLMLIVEPPAARFDIQTSGGYDEHLLERVSGLENRLTQLAERVAQALDLLLRHARNSYLEHALVDTLIGVLSDTRVVHREKLNALWQERCNENATKEDETNRREALRLKIIKSYRRGDYVVFERYINEAMNLLERKQKARAIRRLERAAAIAPDNAPLLTIIGEYFFRAAKMTLARDYLSRALESAPEDRGLCLMLGIACGDEGEIEKAKALLNTAMQHYGNSFAAHYGLGKLLAAEEKWDKALREFKSALVARPSPEAHYVLGCAYYHLGRYRMAKKHLSKAIEIDSDYAEAYYTLGLVFLRTGQSTESSEAFLSATVKEGKTQTSNRDKRRKPGQADPGVSSSLPFATSGRGRKRFITGGNRRLAKALRDDTLKTAHEDIDSVVRFAR